MDEIVSFKQIAEMEKLTTHKSPIGDVSLMVPSISKSIGSPAKAVKHGQVKPVDEEGTKYPLAANTQTLEQDADVETTFNPADKQKEEKKQAASKPSTRLTVGKGKEDISDLRFKVVDNANKLNFGGIHSKYILEGENGKKYLFKPFSSEEAHRVWAEIIANQLAKALGLRHADMGSRPVAVAIPFGMEGNYQGQKVVGSAQEIISNLQANNISRYVDNDFKHCPNDIIEQLQRESVLDWLIGNHDAHKDQFVVDSKGILIGIDKGQAFKYYGSDSLDLGYDPNYNKKHHDQVHHLLLRAAKDGHIKLDWGVIAEFIEHVKTQISPIEWMKLIHPYAEHSAQWGGKVQKFQNIAANRLIGLTTDFKKIYAECNIKTDGATKSKTERTPLTEESKVQADAFMQLDKHFLAKIKKAKAIGHSIMMGGGDIRDMSMLFTHYEWEAEDKKEGRKQGLEVSCEVMPHAEERLVKAFETVQDQDVEYKNMETTLPIGSDPLAGTIMMTAKALHLPPEQKKNPAHYTNFGMFFQQAEEKKSSKQEFKFDPARPLLSPEEIAIKLQGKYISSSVFDDPLSLAHEVAVYYQKIATELLDAIREDKTPAEKEYKPWKGQYSLRKKTVSQKKYPWATFPDFSLDNSSGKLIRGLGEKSAVFDTSTDKSFGTTFKRSMEGGVEVRYYPHYSKALLGQNNFRSQQGRFVIDFYDWDGGIDALFRVRKILKQIGLDHRLATHADVECLYLTRIAWQEKADVLKENEWVKIAQLENNEKKIDALKKLCATVYGTAPDELPTYHPDPKWDEEGGCHYFLNPYVLSYLHDSEPKAVVVLSHEFITGQKNDRISSVVQNGLLASELRLKFRLPTGTSSHQDQITGGAMYVFLRGHLRPADKSKWLDEVENRLVFRPELLARTDMYAYDRDNYGTNNTGPNIDGKAGIKSRLPVTKLMAQKFVSEILFKYRVSLDTWLHGIKKADYGDTADLFKAAIKTKKPHLLNRIKFPGTL